MITTATLECDKIKLINNDGKFITLIIDETQEVKCSSFDLKVIDYEINEVTLTDVVYIRDLDEEHITAQEPKETKLKFEDYLYDFSAYKYDRHVGGVYFYKNFGIDVMAVNDLTGDIIFLEPTLTSIHKLVESGEYPEHLTKLMRAYLAEQSAKSVINSLKEYGYEV